MSAIRAVLFDADGVLQRARHSWDAALDAAGGEGFAEAVFRAEIPALRGEATLLSCLERAAQAQGVDVDVDAVLGLWSEFDVDDEALAVVADIRASGTPCYLATNQQDVRRDVMTRRYRGCFDGYFYSCEVGAMKPEARYFEAVFAALDLPATDVAFIDDSARNVDAARALGIRSVLHDPRDGAVGVRRLLSPLLPDVERRRG